ncbi:MAG: pyridoxal-phosphate dependent enzyme [Chitinophagaceae bacterium]|nr:pyridoxal-phosphate dependent enzyme [Chitinophagaceae bacterium]
MLTERIYVQNIESAWLENNHVFLDVLRLDELHPVVSGNKWFKLKYYLQQAISQGYNAVATFGGAFSNHIIATAFACKQQGLHSIGIIRGEEPDVLSHTLLYAQSLGMLLVFVSREAYKDKQNIIEQYKNESWYFINEGGYGLQGAKGATEILNFVHLSNYTHIIASVGTGTMLAGLIMAAHANQQIIGISSMKGNTGLEAEIIKLLPQNKQHPSFTVFHNYHFGGYAKHPAPLIAFINETWKQFELPLDIVYTGKLFFAVMDLVTKSYFPKQSSLLMIHSGGLQGNRSLQKNELSFL